VFKTPESRSNRGGRRSRHFDFIIRGVVSKGELRGLEHPLRKIFNGGKSGKNCKNRRKNCEKWEK